MAELELLLARSADRTQRAENRAEALTDVLTFLDRDLTQQHLSAVVDTLISIFETEPRLHTSPCCAVLQGAVYVSLRLPSSENYQRARSQSSSSSSTGTDDDERTSKWDELLDRVLLVFRHVASVMVFLIACPVANRQSVNESATMFATSYVHWKLIFRSSADCETIAREFVSPLTANKPGDRSILLRPCIPPESVSVLVKLASSVFFSQRNALAADITLGTPSWVPLMNILVAHASAFTVQDVLTGLMPTAAESTREDVRTITGATDKVLLELVSCDRFWSPPEDDSPGVSLPAGTLELFKFDDARQRCVVGDLASVPLTYRYASLLFLTRAVACVPSPGSDAETTYRLATNLCLYLAAGACPADALKQHQLIGAASVFDLSTIAMDDITSPTVIARQIVAFRCVSMLIEHSMLNHNAQWIEERLIAAVIVALRPHDNGKSRHPHLVEMAAAAFSRFIDHITVTLLSQWVWQPSLSPQYSALLHQVLQLLHRPSATPHRTIVPSWHLLWRLLRAVPSGFLNVSQHVPLLQAVVSTGTWQLEILRCGRDDNASAQLYPDVMPPPGPSIVRRICPCWMPLIAERTVQPSFSRDDALKFVSHAEAFDFVVQAGLVSLLGSLWAAGAFPADCLDPLVNRVLSDLKRLWQHCTVVPCGSRFDLFELRAVRFECVLRSCSEIGDHLGCQPTEESRAVRLRILDTLLSLCPRVVEAPIHLVTTATNVNSPVVLNTLSLWLACHPGEQGLLDAGQRARVCYNPQQPGDGGDLTVQHVHFGDALSLPLEALGFARLHQMCFILAVSLRQGRRTLAHRVRLEKTLALMKILRIFVRADIPAPAYLLLNDGYVTPIDDFSAPGVAIATLVSARPASLPLTAVAQWWSTVGRPGFELDEHYQHISVCVTAAFFLLAVQLGDLAQATATYADLFLTDTFQRRFVSYDPTTWASSFALVCGFCEFGHPEPVAARSDELSRITAQCLEWLDFEERNEPLGWALRTAECIIDNSIQGRGMTVTRLFVSSVLRAARYALTLPQHVHPARPARPNKRESVRVAQRLRPWWPLPDPSAGNGEDEDVEDDAAAQQREDDYIHTDGEGDDADIAQGPVDVECIQNRRAIAAVLACAEWLHKNVPTIGTTVAAPMVASSVMHWLPELRNLPEALPEDAIAFHETSLLWGRLARWAMDPSLSDALLTAAPMGRLELLRCVAVAPLQPWAQGAIEEAIERELRCEEGPMLQRKRSRDE